MQRNIQIDGLTQYQVEMLDYMWSIDREEEYLAWFDSLDYNHQVMASTLRELVILAYNDEVTDCKEAVELLKKVVSQ